MHRIRVQYTQQTRETGLTTVQLIHPQCQIIHCHPCVPSAASSGPSHLENTSLTPILQVHLESSPLPVASMMKLGG